jgi:hypothetical protein
MSLLRGEALTERHNCDRFHWPLLNGDLFRLDMYALICNCQQTVRHGT